ncbi:unnamed protein product [Amoebophrya sp. A25]|nr:unnamed protein product [Amoebophrya sp. A25]|eukprot:GSA25T00008718001.1
MSQGVVWKQLGPLKWLPLMNSLPPCPSQIEDGTKRYAEFKQHCTPFRVEDIRSSLAKAAGGAGGGATPTHARSFLEKETSDAGLEVEDHDQQENVEEQSQDSTRSSFTIKASSSSSSASGGGHNSNTGSKLEDVLAEAFAFTNDQAALQRNSLNNLHDEDKEESPSSWLDLITSHASSAIDAVLETLLQVPPGNGMEAVVTPSSPTMHQRNLHRRPQQERDESVIMVANISTSAEVAATS